MYVIVERLMYVPEYDCFVSEPSLTAVKTLFDTLPSIVLIERYLARAYGIADRLLVLSRGDVVFSGPVSEVTLGEVENMYQLEVADEEVVGEKSAVTERGVVDDLR